MRCFRVCFLAESVTYFTITTLCGAMPVEVGCNVVKSADRQSLIQQFSARFKLNNNTVSLLSTDITTYASRYNLLTSIKVTQNVVEEP